MVKALFWLSLIIVIYTYLGYPLLMMLLGRIQHKPVEKKDCFPGVSLIISAYNEEKHVEEKIKNCLSLDYPKDKLEIIFGSCDDSVYVLSAEGRKLWSYETDFWVAAQSKAVDINQDGKMEVIAGSYDNSVYVFGAEGNFSLNYMPGLSGVMQQPGHYTELISAEVGSYIGKLLLRYNAGGIVTGISVAKERGGEMVVVATGNGKVSELQHKR